MVDKAKADIMFRQMMTDTPDIQGLMLLNLQTRASAAAVLPAGKDIRSLADNAFKLYDSAQRLSPHIGVPAGDTIHLRFEDAIVMLNSNGTLMLLTLTKPQAKLGLIMLDIRRCLDTLSAD